MSDNTYTFAPYDKYIVSNTTGVPLVTTTGHIVKADPMPNMIVFHSIKDGGEMLRIAHDGFYVRGAKIPQDDAEARTVYDAFVSWLRATGHSV